MSKDLWQLFDEGGEGQEQSECLAQCPANSNSSRRSCWWGLRSGGTPRSRTGSSRSLSVVNVRFRRTHTRSYWVHPQLGQWQGWAAPCRGQQQQCLPPADLLLEQILLWEPALTSPMLNLMYFQILSWFGNGSSEPISFGWRTETGPGEWGRDLWDYKCPPYGDWQEFWGILCLSRGGVVQKTSRGSRLVD